MKIRYDDAVEIEKEVNDLDKFVLRFTGILEKYRIKYVIVSGYVSILFGRSRLSEDIDIIIEKISMEEFRNLWKAINDEFECIITTDCEEAYDKYLKELCAIRFSEKERFVPNIEMKFPKIKPEFWSLNNAKKVDLNGRRLMISPIELQIAFKLYLGSEKDIEDAKHLYIIFEQKLDKKLLMDFAAKLKVTNMFNLYLRNRNEGA
jgi:hypothetical protein